MKLSLVVPVISALLRQMGQKDLADQVTDALAELAVEVAQLKQKTERLEQKYQQLGRDIERMVRARGISRDS